MHFKTIDLLHKSIASATTSLVFLQLGKLKLAERLKHICQIFFCDAEMDVADVEPMKRNTRVGTVMTSIVSGTGLTILLRFRKLGDDGYS